MSLKANIKSQGFTIVELLIVVIVIAILATITIVSYNNITGRANVAAANAAVATFQKKAELYVADGGTGKYPVQSTDLTSDASKSYFLPGTTFSFVTAANPAGITADNGKNTVAVRKCAASAANQAAITSTNITGLEVVYWDYANNTAAAKQFGVTTVCPTS